MNGWSLVLTLKLRRLYFKPPLHSAPFIDHPHTPHPHMAFSLHINASYIDTAERVKGFCHFKSNTVPASEEVYEAIKKSFPSTLTLHLAEEGQLQRPYPQGFCLQHSNTSIPTRDQRCRVHVWVHVSSPHS